MYASFYLNLNNSDKDWWNERTRNLRERSLMTSDIRVGRGSKIAQKKGRYGVEQGRKVGQKWPKNEGRH